MSENSLAMMPWFPRDYIAATRAMRLAERGAYLDLLNFQWEMGRLPAEHERLAQLLGVSLSEFKSVWPALRSKFIADGDSIFNQRLEEHRKFALDQRAKKRLGAIATNAKRYGERPAERVAHAASAERVAIYVADASPPSPSPSPSSKEKKTPSLRSGAKESGTGSRSARPATGCRLPDDFELTPQRRAVAEAETLPAERTFAKFTDHFRSASGARARKLDWDATWRNWCRSEIDRKPNGNGDTRRLTRYEQAFGKDDAVVVDGPSVPSVAR